MPTFHLLNFGCRASQADGAALKKQLLDAGLCEVRRVEQSQVAVLNTCTVTASADAEVRQVIRRVHRANPECRILVTGCYAQRAAEEIAQLEGVAWVVGNSHKHTVAELLTDAVGRALGNADSNRAASGDPGRPNFAAAELVQIRNSPIDAGTDRTPEAAEVEKGLNTSASPLPAEDWRAKVRVGEISNEFHFAPVFPDDRTRPTLKVQDGCDARCSFCIIPAVRGASRSLAPETVIEQIQQLERAGFQEIVLSGINLGSYGRDLGRRITFFGLLERILSATLIARVRISSIEPMDISRELIRLVAGVPRLAQHFHVPLQSGCDRILRQMNRRYWIRQYAERILAIREQLPNCGIGADVMVGFPGETDHDHSDSVRFLDSIPLTYVHVFPYSSRPMTPAATRPNPVNGRVAHDRSREIRSLIAGKRQAFLAAQVGRTLSALALDERGERMRVALTSNYLKVAMPGFDLPRNTLLDVQVGRTDGDLLYGYPATDSSTRLGQLLPIPATC